MIIYLLISEVVIIELYLGGTLSYNLILLLNLLQLIISQVPSVIT
jgi:hypothetical protein